MYNTPNSPLRSNIKLWNETAKDCYFIGCDCSKCFIYNTFFKDTGELCQMRYYVEKFLQKLGRPDSKGGKCDGI